MARQATARARSTKEADATTPAAVLDPPTHPDQALVQTNGAQILGFIRNIAAFFGTARELEMAAQSTLVKARELQPPATAEDDERIQRFIREANADRKRIEDHWSITTVFHQVHRNLTAARGRGVKFLEDAAARAQRLHNDYVEEARRKAAAEQERIRREAEEKARQEREAEAARIEAAALEQEAAMPDLSEREEMFVDLVFGMTPHIEAARRSGYKDPVTMADRLMKTRKIVEAIQARRDAHALRQQAAARREQPLDVRVETVKADVIKTGTDRTTHSAEILDEARLIEACIAGGYGIPHDILTVKPAKVNEYARALQERINRWPGVKHVKTTKTI